MMIEHGSLCFHRCLSPSLVRDTNFTRVLLSLLDTLDLERLIHLGQLVE